ncbi:hypothetical protein HGM15179_000428 [Zosterops borbonicus]|uniref:Uncharacterized protein n=1 Tax=Zosterops borbonicus TaxID=364589 RepID=A0A8K1LUL5_9PASS|nr:hypothetical protein HGM15179_000428 [Zosterops borbonicus]
MTQGYRADDRHLYDNDTSFRRQKTLVITRTCYQDSASSPQPNPPDPSSQSNSNCSVTNKCQQWPESSEGTGRDWESEEPPTVDPVRDHLRHLRVHKAMGPDEVNLQALREPADEVAKPSIIFEKLWQSHEVPIDWKKGIIAPTLKEGGKGRSTEIQTNLTTVPARIMR